MIRACITYGTAVPTDEHPFGDISRVWWACDTCGTDGDGDKPDTCPVCATPASEEPA